MRTPVPDRAEDDRRCRVRTRHRQRKSSSSGFSFICAPSRQEDGLGFHRPVGLLRRFLDDNLPLKDADRVVVDDRSIDSRLVPPGAGMNDLQRRIGAPRASMSASPPSDTLARSPVMLTKICRRVRSPPETSPKAPSCAVSASSQVWVSTCQPRLVPDDRHVLRHSPGRNRQDRGAMALHARVRAVEYLHERGLRAGASTKAARE